jgi:predicted ATPase
MIMTTQPTSSQQVLQKLQSIFDNQSADNTLEQIESARDWFNIINQSSELAETNDFDIVFIGKVGIGKSSLISTAANLLIGDKPTDKNSLQKNSVLAIASGRTTVCEVKIGNNPAGNIQLHLNSFDREAMATEIRLYAEDVFRRYNKNIAVESKDGEQDDPMGQELQRALSNITGYPEGSESYSDAKGMQRRRATYPIRQAVKDFNSSQEFAEHLVSKAMLDSRIQTEWILDSYESLKQLFHAINTGNQVNASLPQQVTLLVPGFLADADTQFNLIFTDTRGLEAGVVTARRDIRRHLRNPNALFVLCSSFNAAPDVEIHTLLRSLVDDAELQPALSRLLLVLLDWGDASTVNNANGDRLLGQDIKIGECIDFLEKAGLSLAISNMPIVAFDALSDDRECFNEKLYEQLTLIFRDRHVILDKYISKANEFLLGIDSSENAVKRADMEHIINNRLLEAMLPFTSITAPVPDPLQGLYQAIYNSNYASPVYASCRRNGYYDKLDLYAAIENELSRAVTQKLNALFTAINSVLCFFLDDPSYQLIADLISLKQKKYQDARIEVQRYYVDQVCTQVTTELSNSVVWEHCQDEWGKGAGFVNRVIAHLQKWSKQQAFNEHETVLLERIPLFTQLQVSKQAPQFTLVVRNLLVLSKVDWHLDASVSLLIGANGAGKTTLLKALAFLNLAYRRGLVFALQQVFGSIDIRSWESHTQEPIEIGLNVADISWRIELYPTGATQILVKESLYTGDRLVYSSDNFGQLIYQNEYLKQESEPSTEIGLRKLKNRGIDHPAVQQIVTFLQKIAMYRLPATETLQNFGSKNTENNRLNSNGDNSLTLLRRWYLEKNNLFRYDFVIEGLAAAFPNIFEQLDFEEAGQLISARIYRPDSDRPNPLKNEADGLIQLLILFCEIAAAEDASLVAIDEPENFLHPYAIRVFWRHTCRWADKHNLTVILSTHSTVLLDELTGKPELVYVLKKPDDNHYMPTRLDKIYNIEWLKQFEFGDLYEQGEIGSNEDKA